MASPIVSTSLAKTRLPKYFCGCCEITFDDAISEKKHSMTLQHHFRMETLHQPFWHRCDLCKFSCDMLADYSKHINSNEHKKLYKETIKFLSRSEERRLAKKRKISQQQKEALNNASSMPQFSSVSEGFLPQYTPSPYVFPSRTCLPPSSSPYRLDNQFVKSPLIPTPPQVGYWGYFQRNTPRIAAPQSVIDQGHTPTTSSTSILPLGMSGSQMVYRNDRRVEMTETVGHTKPTTEKPSSNGLEDKSSAIGVTTKRKTLSIGDVTTTKRRKIVAQADSTTPARNRGATSATKVDRNKSTRWQRMKSLFCKKNTQNESKLTEQSATRRTATVTPKMCCPVTPLPNISKLILQEVDEAVNSIDDVRMLTPGPPSRLPREREDAAPISVNFAVLKQETPSKAQMNLKRSGDHSQRFEADLQTSRTRTPLSDSLKEMWVLCQQEEQKNAQLAETKLRIQRLQSEMYEAVQHQLQIDIELLAITSKKKELLAKQLCKAIN